MRFRNFIKRYSILGVLLLVACQPLERPFQPEVKTGLRTVPGPRAYLYVASVQNGPADLDTAVAKKLQELGIAAFAGKEVPDRYYLRGDMIDEGGLQFVQWTIFDPQNQNTGLYTLEKFPDLAQPSSAKPQNIEEFVLHSASNIDRLLGGDGVNFAALKNRFFTCQLSGELLATALKACLSPFKKNWSGWGSTCCQRRAGPTILSEEKQNCPLQSLERKSFFSPGVWNVATANRSVKFSSATESRQARLTVHGARQRLWPRKAVRKGF